MEISTILAQEKLALKDLQNMVKQYPGMVDNENEIVERQEIIVNALVEYANGQKKVD